MEIKGTPQRGLFGATLGFFIGFAAVALFGTTAQKLKDVMQLTPVMVGFLVAIPSLTGSLLRIPFAAWVDVTGGRKPLLVLLSLSILGMLGLTLTIYSLYPDRLTPGMYPLILFLGALSGCGIATFSVGISQASYWSPKSKQGSALGIYGGVGNLAPGIFTLILPLALTAAGLAGAYLIWLLLLVAGTVLYYFTGINAPYFQLRAQGLSSEQARQAAAKAGQEIFPAGNIKESLFLSAKVWKTWAFVAIYFASFGGFLAMTAWLPTYWKSFFGATAVTAGFLTAAYSILASLMRVLGGSLSDRLGGERTAILALFTMLVGACMLTFSHSFGISIIAELIMALGMGVTNAAVFKLVPKEVPQAVGGASGWVGGLGAFGGFAIPPLLSAFVRWQGEGGYATGFATYIVLALVSLGLAFTLQSFHAKALVPQATD
jgi:NNP family nitrate/nitrite transporter-like MFS transporter